LHHWSASNPVTVTVDDFQFFLSCIEIVQTSGTPRSFPYFQFFLSCIEHLGDERVGPLAWILSILSELHRRPR